MKFEFIASKGGRIYEQEGGFAAYGISSDEPGTVTLGNGDEIPCRDILEIAVQHFNPEVGAWGSTDLPPFKLTIEFIEEGE